jgi:site-specific recombinase XerD
LKTITELPPFLAKFINACEEKGRQPSTIKRYVYDLNDFSQWIHVTKGSVSEEIWLKLSEEDVSSYYHFLLNEREYSVRTMKRIATVLRQLRRFYDEEGISLTVPDVSFKEAHNVQNLSEEDVISENELKSLLKSIPSPEGLTENQLKSRPLLNDRNVSIILLLSEAGLTLHELVSLTMNDIFFERNLIYVPSTTSNSRTINISKDMKVQLFRYYKSIPKPVRPRLHSTDPFFIAFDFQRNTYRWVYDVNAPKGLTPISVQKLIRQEGQRAGIRKGISAQHMRNSAILKAIEKNINKAVIQETFGFKAEISLNRYYQFVESK